MGCSISTMATDAMLVGAAFALVFAVLLLVAVLAARKWWRSLRARRRARRAHHGERGARALLESAGYDVLDDQVRHTYTVRCDGDDLPIELRADYLVRRGRKRYVADVKTGPRAPRISTAATRRQLLEYRVAYDVSGVLLVDMHREHIHVIGFDLPAR